MGFLLALAPVAAIIWYIYIKDEYDREPLVLLVLSFFFGIVSVIPALLGGSLGAWLGFDLSDNLFDTFIHAFLVVGLSEELGKFLFLVLFLYPRKDFDEPYDGIVYAVMIGMGFATFENFVYVKDGGVEVAILRMFTAIPAHAAFGVIMGYYVGLAKFSETRRESTPILLFMGLTWAVLAHGGYDFFLMQQSYDWLSILSFVILLAAIYFAKTAVKIHVENSPFHPSRVGQNATDGIKGKVISSESVDTEEVAKQRRRAFFAKRKAMLKKKEEEEEKERQRKAKLRSHTKPILEQKKKEQKIIKKEIEPSKSKPKTTIKGSLSTSPPPPKKQKQVPPPRRRRRKD